MQIEVTAQWLEKCKNTITDMVEAIYQRPSVSLMDMKSNKTVLVMVDMINGFVREGALKSERVEALIPGIVALSRACDQRGIAKIAFSDCHTENSPEFGSYPTHCMMGTSEGEIVDELKEVGGYRLMRKNSTNGFLEPVFQQWLLENQTLDTFIVTGDCTDICVMQFAVTAKTWFNMKNRDVRVIVPVNAVETYDFGVHNGDLLNVFALYTMLGNGVEVVKTIEL